MDNRSKLERLIRRMTVSSNDDLAALQSIYDTAKAIPLRDEDRHPCQAVLAAFVANADVIKTRPASYIFASGFLSSEFRDPRGLEALQTVFKFVQDPYQKNSIFWSIIRYASVNATPFQKEISSLYFNLLESWPVQKLTLGDIPKLNFDSLIIVPQFLTPQHAPTADALDYCRILRSLGFNPLLLHTNELPDKINLPLPDGFVVNKRHDLQGIQNVELDGESFVMFTPSGPMPSEEGLAIILAFVRALDLRLCIFSAAWSLIQEDIGAIAPSVILPTSTNLAPSRTCTSILFNDLSATDVDIITAEKLDRSRIWDGYKYNYRLPPGANEVYTRAHFGARDDSFVITLVGNRLPQEIDNEIKDLLLKLIRANPAIHILLVGPLDNQTKARWKNEFGSAIGFCEYAQNLPALYQICDLYLNPKRSGGGTSAALALSASLPVYTFQTGDVARIVPSTFLFNNSAAMHNAVVSLANSSERDIEKQAAVAAWRKISGRTSLVAGILKRMGLLPEMDRQP